MPSSTTNSFGKPRYPGKLLFLLLVVSFALQSIAFAQSSSYERGCQSFDRGEWEGAVAAFSEAIQQDPNNDDAYYKRGLAYGKLNEPEKSYNDLDKACNLKPDNATYDRARYDISGKASSDVLDGAWKDAKKLNKKKRFEEELPLKIVMSIVSAAVIGAYWFFFKRKKAEGPLRILALVFGIGLTLVLALFIVLSLVP